MATTKKTTKNDRVYVRLNAETKEDFETVAKYRGLQTSSLLHSLIVKTIHEERENRPHIFADKIKDKGLNAKNSENEEKVSVNAKKGKSKNKDQFLKTGDGNIPLVDEASSTGDDEQ